METICSTAKLNRFQNWYLKFDIYVKLKKKDTSACTRVTYADTGEHE